MTLVGSFFELAGVIYKWMEVVTKWCFALPEHILIWFLG